MGSGEQNRESCPRCGTSLAERGAMKGVCPRCLLLGLLDEEDGGTSLGTASGDQEKTERSVTFGADFPRKGAEQAASSRLDPPPPMRAAPIPNTSPPGASDPIGLFDADGEPTVIEATPPPVINGHRVLRPIGEGGMGIVYLGHHVELDKPVAIKLLRAEYRKSAELVERFFEEARAAVRIGTEYIVDITDLGRLDDGTPYFIMEWLDGRNLKQLLEAEGPLGAARALRILSQVARAIGPAHQRGIVHRDLKPENVFLIRRGDDPEFVKVLDFGIAKLMGDDPRSRRTRTGTIVGTVDYMSPEQCRGRSDQIDHRADIYSIGVMLYQMVTGRLPFEGEAFGEIMEQHLISTPVAPSLRRPGIAAGVDAVVLKAMSKAPVDRQRSVEELVEELRGAVAGVGAVRGIATAPARVVPVAEVVAVKKRRGFVVGVIAVALAVLGVGASRMVRRAAVAAPITPREDDHNPPKDAIALVPELPKSAGPPEVESPVAKPPAVRAPKRTAAQGSGRISPEKPPAVTATPAKPESLVVIVTAEPEDASVWLNSTKQCPATPCKLFLEGDGPFEVELRAHLFEPWSRGFRDLADVRSNAALLQGVRMKAEKKQ